MITNAGPNSPRSAPRKLLFFLLVTPRSQPKGGLSYFQRIEGHYVLPSDLENAAAPRRERVEAAATPRPAGSRLRRLASKLWRFSRG